MLLRRRLMCLKSKTNPVQHYDNDGMDSEGLGINLSMALSNDLDKDSTALGINVSIALEAA